MTTPGPDFTDFEVLDNQAPPVKRFDWLSVIQFGFSLSAGLLFFGAAFLGLLVMLFEGTNSTQLIPENQILSSYLFSAGLGFAGLLMIPSIYYSGRSIIKREARDRIKLNWFGRITWIFPLLILAGYLVQTGPAWAKTFLLVLHPLANSAAIFWALNLVYKKNESGSSRRFWGAFGSGLTVIPVIAFISEIIILIFLGIVWMVILSSQTDLRQELMELVSQLQNSNLNPELLESSTGRLISQPGITATVFIYIAVLIPIVEEFLKPIVLWFTLDRKLTPKEGFLIGAASGAGYALFENLTIGAVADVWTFVTITRIGTAAVHIITTGLVGWGITSLISDRKYLRLVFAYLAAVLLHGVWNGLNMLNGLADIPTVRETLSSFSGYLADYAPIGLVLLAAGSFVGLIRANSWFRRAIITQSTEESEV